MHKVMVQLSSAGDVWQHTLQLQLLPWLPILQHIHLYVYRYLWNHVVYHMTLCLYSSDLMILQCTL